jgi:hypothetical protein
LPAKKKPKHRSRREPLATAADESRAGEALTVFWMLTMMATLAAELAALVAGLLIAGAEKPAEIPLALRVLPGLMLSIALVTGVLCLALSPLVYKVRKAPPPTGVTVIAVAIGASPLVLLLLARLNSA